MDIENKVIRLIEKTLGSKNGEITRETGIGDIPKWDSLGHLKIITTLEKEFQIEFDANMIFDIENVEGFIFAIKKLFRDGEFNN